MSFAGKLLPDAGSSKIAYLDVVRGVAVLFVFTRHAWGLAGAPELTVGPIRFGNLIAMMSSGVDLFFVLSGVLLAPRFLRLGSVGHAVLVPYFKSRLARIGPPYWLALVLVVLLYTPSLIPDQAVWSARGAAIFLAHALFLQGSFVFSFGAYPVATPFWTLSVEIIFYALLPFFARYFSGRRWYVALPVTLLISVGWLMASRYALDDVVHFVDFGLHFPGEVLRLFLSHQIPGYAFHFGVGIAIAAIIEKPGGSDPNVALPSPGMSYACLFAGITLLVVVMYGLGDVAIEKGFGDPLVYMRSEAWPARLYYASDRISFAFAYGLIILGLATAGRRVQDVVGRLPLLRSLGVCGYSIYLLHMPLLWTVHQYSWIAGTPTPTVFFAKMFLFGGAVVLGVSFLFYLAVERPSTELSHRLRALRRTPKLEAA